ncbi:mob1 family protein [Diplogelasinospora grovesii]|uniref:Mob1 family protein n=1 Tax=Diplogelasinospora grovesii TaxID=303347 RepID=A0AAN6NDP0_9PEZI|nr:mob1 family protein [Diplogelasinospora grovesii]
MAALPPSSPRLPSPPPPAEIQIGPKSPAMGPKQQQIEQTAIDANAKRRIHPGTKAADMAAGPPLVPLNELDSAFQLQEHLAALHYYHTASRTLAMTRETAKTLATPPPGIDKTLWLYELCRFLIAQCNSLIVGFLFDTPPCSAATCPEMRASEWQFLCAVHDAPKSCCAIDYCCHTLDWATNVVTNPKIFPSRFVVDAHDKTMALKNLINVFRRLHRIFAHAWFQHRGVFWAVEGQTGLYVFFKTVCDVYDLLPSENYKLPPEAEGLDSSSSSVLLLDGGAERKVQQQPVPTSIAKPPRGGEGLGVEGDPLSRTNTRRHIKSSPSTGSAVTTVMEADEDNDHSAAAVTNKLKNMHISRPNPPNPSDEGLELASIPVIVEHQTIDQPPLRPSSVVPLSGVWPQQTQQESPAPPPSEPNRHQTSVKVEEKEPEPEPEPAVEQPEKNATPAAASEPEPAQTKEEGPDEMHKEPELPEPPVPKEADADESESDGGDDDETIIGASEDDDEPDAAEDAHAPPPPPAPEKPPAEIQPKPTPESAEVVATDTPAPAGEKEDDEKEDGKPASEAVSEAAEHADKPPADSDDDKKKAEDDETKPSSSSDEQTATKPEE